MNYKEEPRKESCYLGYLSLKKQTNMFLILFFFLLFYDISKKYSMMLTQRDYCSLILGHSNQIKVKSLSVFINKCTITIQPLVLQESFGILKSFVYNAPFLSDINFNVILLILREKSIWHKQQTNIFQKEILA